MMGTTVLLKRSKQLYCPIRKEFVLETPEESVRQFTLSSLFSLGYPPSLVIVERKISELPHVVTRSSTLPNRRVDILCYKRENLEPLLLVECKSKSFSSKELRQLCGYNLYIGAPFVALVNSERVHLFHPKSFVLYEAIPTYMDLIG